jgi:nucleoside-diphosphate-sugar epimerase
LRIHVLGGTGFLGRRLVPRLAATHDLSALTRSTSAASQISELGARPVPGDVGEPASVEAVLEAERPDVLLTSVSLGLGYGPHIVSTAERLGIRRGLFVSTTSIYTELDSASKPSRLQAEDAITASTLDWTIVRPTMIYGAPDDRNLARLLRLIQRSRVVPLPGGSGLHQPVHVDDVVGAIVRAVDDPVSIGKSYELAGPRPMTLRELVTASAGALDRRITMVPVPLGPLIRIARLYERIATRPRIRAEQFERLAEDKVFDITAAHVELGFAPRSFAEGIGAEAEMLTS